MSNFNDPGDVQEEVQEGTPTPSLPAEADATATEGVGALVD